MRIGVLGAGLSGTLLALQLAEAGHDVTVIDRKPLALAGASHASEGKLHLGYVYAADQSRRTAHAMATATARFRPLIERWLGRDTFDHALSSPFHYAVPRDSQIDTDGVRRHFSAVSEAVRTACRETRAPECEPHWRELSVSEYGALFDPEHIAAVFATGERSIQPDVICGQLRSALASQPRINLLLSHHVESVSHEGAGFTVSGRADTHLFSERFDVVANALWEQRLRVDAAVTRPFQGDVIHRFKYGLWSNSALIAAHMPSVTFIVGSYGDCVAFADTVYASWYPACLASEEVALSPSRQDFSLTADDRETLIAETLRSLSRLMPGVCNALSADRNSWNPRGGFITAWGHTGIDDVRSELHERYRVGVHSDGNWHSIDTGKFTMAPMFAAEACARILAGRGSRT